MRELGRLLKTMRFESEMKVSSLTQMLDPTNFDLLLRCVKILAEYDETSKQFKKGSLALRLGYSLKTCALILQSEAIKTEDELLSSKVQRFNTLFQGDWYSCISASALQSIHRVRYNECKLLPACSDIEKIHILLSQKVKAKNSDYATLTKATLCSINLFNRKRGGEVQRMKVQDFEKGINNGSHGDPEILEGLTEIEKKMVQFFSRIEIRGKFSRKVPILLTKEMIASIKTILQKRQEEFPPIDSPYLFVSKTGSRPYRGSDVIREFAKEAGVENISIFTFTNMRKQVATLSQCLEITKWEQDQLATFLGHDIRIHRNVYRQPVDILEKAKVAKILLSVNKGIQLPFDSTVVDESDEIEPDDDDDNAICSDDDDCNPGDITSSSNLSRVISKSNTKEIATVSSTAYPPVNSAKQMSSSQKKRNVTMNENVTSTVTHVGLVNTRKRSETNVCSVYDFDEEIGPSQDKKKKFIRKSWSQPEKDASERRLHHCLVMRKVPQKEQIENVIACEPVLKNRTWRNVKDYVYNIVRKN